MLRNITLLLNTIFNTCCVVDAYNVFDYSLLYLIVDFEKQYNKGSVILLDNEC